MFARTGTDCSEESFGELMEMSQSGETIILQNMVHVSLKLSADLQDTPGHDKYWKGLDMEHIIRVIPDCMWSFDFSLVAYLC